MKIAKHFVTVGKRPVHYLRAGSGPVLSRLAPVVTNWTNARLPLLLSQT